jgi:hypothetical protein
MKTAAQIGKTKASKIAITFERAGEIEVEFHRSFDKNQNTQIIRITRKVAKQFGFELSKNSPTFFTTERCRGRISQWTRVRMPWDFPKFDSEITEPFTRFADALKAGYRRSKSLSLSV